MAHPLEAVALKIQRASKHADELEVEIDAFLKSDPYEPVSHFDPDKQTGLGDPGNGALVYRLVARKEVPPQIGVLIGETLQQLRSALDHIIWQLSLLTTDTPRLTSEFPIFDNATGYANNWERKSGDVPTTAQTVIDGMQPHIQPTPKEDPVWMLHRLANEDKHRLPHLVGGMATRVHAAKLDGVSSIVFAPGPFTDETEVVIAAVSDLEKACVAMETLNLAGGLTLCFDPVGPGLGRPVMELLRVFGFGTDATLDAFRKFFP